MSRYPRYRTPCEHWLQAPDGTWYRCGAVPTRHYLTGHKCRQHTPAALAGHPEPSSFLTRPAKPLIPPQNDSRLVAERAIASGKRRSSPRQLRGRTRRTTAQKGGEPPWLTHASLAIFAGS